MCKNGLLGASVERFHLLPLYFLYSVSNESRNSADKWDWWKRVLQVKPGMAIHPHYFNLSISLTPLTLSLLWQRVLSASDHCQGLICVICKPIDPIPQLKMSSVTFSYSLTWWAQSSGVPLFGDSLHWSTLFVYFLQPVSGQYLDLWAPPHFYLQSPSRQTSINGARWGDNEAPRHRLGEVGEWQTHTGLSLLHRNKRRTWTRREDASRVRKTNPCMSCIKAWPVQMASLPANTWKAPHTKLVAYTATYSKVRFTDK